MQKTIAPDWKATELWRVLEAREGQEAESVRQFVRPWLDEVQTLLAKSGTAPLDFTLHDDEHSFRVAQRMADLIPKHTLEKLSVFELALLLKAAYFHDIGMNPRRTIVRQIRDFLFSGDLGELPETEARLLQTWLDENHPGIEPPIRGNSDSDRLYFADLYTAYFCRYRHNDWSEQFIIDRANRSERPPYPAWTSDLVALCQSHHYGLATLMQDDFNLRIVGPGNQLVNLRYLAILRLADVLEFDPERSPEVVFDIRSIDRNSRIYWYKDHEIALSIDRELSRIVITARTTDAWTHKAVLDTVDMVNHELETCASIMHQSRFALLERRPLERMDKPRPGGRIGAGLDSDARRAPQWRPAFILKG